MAAPFYTFAIRRVHFVSKFSAPSAKWLNSVTSLDSPDKLLREFMAIEKQLSPDQVVAIFSRLSKFPHTQSLDLTHIKLAIRRRCYCFRPSHLNTTVHATNQLRIVDPQFQVSIFSHINCMYHKYSLTEKISLICGLINYPILEQNFLNFLANDVATSSKKMTREELTLTTYAFSRLNVYSLPLFEALRDRTIELSGHLNAPQLSVIITAWNKWDIHYEQLISTFCREVYVKCETFTVRELESVFRMFIVFEKNGIKHDASLLRMCDEVEKKSGDLTPDSIALVLTVLSKFQLAVKDDFIRILCGLAKNALLEDFTPLSLSQFLSALANLNVFDPPLFAMFFQHATTLSFSSHAASLLKTLIWFSFVDQTELSRWDQIAVARQLLQQIPIPVGVSLYAEDLATVFRAIRVFGLHIECEQLLEALCVATFALPNQLFEATHVVDILATLAVFGHMDRALAQKLSSILYGLPRLDCDATQTVDLLRSLAHFSLYNGRLISSICAQVLVNAERFEPDQAVCTLHALCVMNHYAQDTFEALRGVLRSDMLMYSTEDLVLLDETNLALSLDQPTWPLLPSPNSERAVKPMSEFHEQVSCALDRLNRAHVSQHNVSGLQVDIAIQTASNETIALQLEQVYVPRKKVGEMSGRFLFQRRLLRQLKWDAVSISSARWPTKHADQDRLISDTLSFRESQMHDGRVLAESPELSRDSPDFHLDFTRRYAHIIPREAIPDNGMSSQPLTISQQPIPDGLLPDRNSDNGMYSLPSRQPTRNASRNNQGEDDQ